MSTEEAATGRSRPRTALLTFIFIAIAALLLRLWGLDAHSLSMDEVSEIENAEQPFHQVVVNPDGFPPLNLVLSHLWLRAGGNPPGLRLLSVIYGVGAVLGVWRLGRMVGDERTGLISALLLAISPLHIWFSREARAYSLYFLLAVLAMWLFYRARATDRARDWAWYFVVAVLGVYTHYYFALLIGCLVLTSCLEPTGPGVAWRRLAWTHVAVALLALPWVVLLPGDVGAQQEFVLARPPIDFVAMGYAVFTFLAGFGIGPSLRELHTARPAEVIRELLPWIVALAVSCLYLTWEVRRSPGAWLWGRRFVVLVALPVGICGVLGAWLGLGFRVRYMVWCAAPLLCFLAFGIAQRPQAWRTRLALCILTLLSVVSIFNSRTVSRYLTEDMRGAARYLTLASDESPPIFVVADYMAGPLRYYIHDEKRVFGLPGVDGPGGTKAALELIRRGVAPGQPFWLVYSRAFDGDPHGHLLAILRDHADLVNRTRMPGVDVYEGRGF